MYEHLRRDPLIVAYLKACGYSPRKVRRTYLAFARKIGLAPPRKRRPGRTPAPTTPKLAHVLREMDRLHPDRNPERVNPDAYEQACGAVEFARRARAKITKALHPTDYLTLRRKATRALEHALARRDALAYTLNDIMPGSVPSPNPKPAYVKRPPGEAQRLATLRYTLRNARTREEGLAVSYDAARAHVRALQARYDTASAKYALEVRTDEQLLAHRRAKFGMGTRRSRYAVKHLKAQAATLRELRDELRAAKAKAEPMRAALAKSRERVRILEEKII